MEEVKRRKTPEALRKINCNATHSRISRTKSSRFREERQHAAKHSTEIMFPDEEQIVSPSKNNEEKVFKSGKLIFRRCG
jgi:hypothetical protein